MEEERGLNPPPPPELLEASSTFVSFPGVQNDASVKEFLDRFPLPVLFSALQSEMYVSELQESLVSCLDKIFSTKHGASFLPNFIPFLQAGLQAGSESIKWLACKAVLHLLDITDEKEAALQIIIEYTIYPLLISCLLDGNEQTSAASMDAIKSIAQFPDGIVIIFPSNSDDPMQLRNIAVRSSSLGRVRILALISKLYSVSNSVASEIHKSDLLKLFESEINNGKDRLAALNSMELLYELVESSNDPTLLLKSSLLQLLVNIISNDSVDSILRSRSALISARLLRSADAHSTVDQSVVTKLVSAIGGRLNLIHENTQNKNECEIYLESLGLIGATNHGANQMLTNSKDVAKLVVESAFDRQNRGKQLAGLLALGSICGADRSEENILLNETAEECLKSLIYNTASNSSKFTPSGLLLSLLQQEPEVRLAGYRLIAVLAARHWCLAEICSKQEIISIVTDPSIESTKNGMDARHACCVAINNSLSSSSLISNFTATGVAGKLQEAVKRGPYSAKKRVESQPVVGVMERF
ncbi:hypothetical protein LUZ60_001082 [Juncus effusus]|nr:hypothetical protein LUZ60_001082 [Juncus effusus]